jgi:choline dehydrogenase-like flavoprotein
MFDVNGRTLNQELSPLSVLRAGRDLIVHRRGLATAAMTHAVAFGKIHQDAPWAEYELMFSPMSAVSGRPEALPGEEADLAEASAPKKNKQRVNLPDRPMVSCHVSLLHPRSTGQVRASTLNPFDLPKIDLAYYGDERDIVDAAAAGRLTRSIFASNALKPYVIRETGPSAGVETDEQWREFLTQNTFNAGHWVGTVRMGAADDDHAALDSDLRVKGVEALRVIDASVMPNLTSGNTNAPTIALAEAGVHRLLTGGWREPGSTGQPGSQHRGSDVG